MLPEKVGAADANCVGVCGGGVEVAVSSFDSGGDNLRAPFSFEPICKANLTPYHVMQHLKMVSVSENCTTDPPKKSRFDILQYPTSKNGYAVVTMKTEFKVCYR